MVSDGERVHERPRHGLLPADAILDRLDHRLSHGDGCPTDLEGLPLAGQEDRRTEETC